MEGLYFYAVAWAVWIIATFILEKNNNIRLPLAFIILLCIIISPYTFTFKEYTVSYVSILLLMATLVKIGTQTFKGKCYFFITSLVISVGYVTFLLFELFDPIWIIFKREWMLSILITYLSVLLQQKLIWRITTALIGCIYGEILYAIILNRYSFPYIVGSMSFLDICSLITVILFGWHGLKQVIAYFEQQYQSSEREKQKTT